MKACIREFRLPLFQEHRGSDSYLHSVAMQTVSLQQYNLKHFSNMFPNNNKSTTLQAYCQFIRWWPCAGTREDPNKNACAAA